MNKEQRAQAVRFSPSRPCSQAERSVTVRSMSSIVSKNQFTAPLTGRYIQCHELQDTRFLQ